MMTLTEFSPAGRGIRRLARSGSRTARHPPTRGCSPARRQRQEHRLRLRRRPVGRRPRRQEPPPAHQRHRRRVATRSSRPTAQTIAFSAQYDGNTDVYTIPRRGRRADTADLAPRPGHRPRLHARRQERAVLLAAARLHQPAHATLHRAARPAACRRSCRSPRASRPRYSPDGDYIAYTPLRDAHRRSGSTTAAARTRASGSTASRTTTSIEIPQPKDRCNDLDPHWVGEHGLLPLRPRRRVQPVRLRRRHRRR